MRKILFITTRNVFTTSGEFRLIKNRTKTLYEKWGIITDFIAISSKEKIRKRNENIGYNSIINPIEINFYNPVSVILSFFHVRREIIKKLNRNDYKCIVLSGVLTYVFINLLKKYRSDIPIIADIHGATEELIEFKDDNFLKRFMKNLLYRYNEYSQKKRLNLFDGTFVVSNALVEYLNKKYSLNKNIKHYVVPCALENIDFDEKFVKQNRNIYRKKYGIDKDEILFIYSGGVSPWQCIDKSIELFTKFQLKSNRKAKLLILSHRIDKVKSITEGNESIILDSISPDKVKKVLCAGDYAFLIRDNFITNNVAFPNKFLEYVQSGMKIITTPHVYDVSKQIEKYKIGIIIDLEKDSIDKLEKYVNERNVFNDFENRKKLLHNLSFEKTLSSFVKDLILNK